jgi:uncharacterized tellurite resistance protein B-like protein
MELTLQEENLYRAIAELAYAVAGADNEVTDDEIEAFEKAVSQNLIEAEKIVIHHFRFLSQDKRPRLDLNYQHALSIIELNKSALDRIRIRKFMYILERVAEVGGVIEAERDLLDKFELDLLHIHASKKSEKDLHMSPELANLYSTVGQLAYTMSIADHVFLKEEQDTFLEVIKENLGEFDWLAKDRFKAVQDIMVKDVDAMYEHALYLIRKNVSALYEGMIDTFVNVIFKVAEVAGVTREEQALMDRFEQDIREIYNKEKGI